MDENEDGYNARREAGKVATLLFQLSGVKYVATVLLGDFQRWCQKNKYLCRSVIRLTAEESLKIAEGDMRERMMSRFGPAVCHSGTMLAFLTAWPELPAAEFGESCAALAAELVTSRERCMPRLRNTERAHSHDPLELVTFATGGHDIFDRQQRRRIWGPMGTRLDSLEQHLQGSSYAYFEFKACSVLRNLAVNFLGTWLVPDVDTDNRGEPGSLAGVQAMQVAVQKMAELDDHLTRGTQPPPRIELRAHDSDDDASMAGGSHRHEGGACPCCGRSPRGSPAVDGAAGSSAGTGGCSPGGSAAGGGAASSTPGSDTSPAPATAAAGSALVQDQQQPQQPAGDPSQWRVAQLRAFLGARGVDCRGCIEKHQLVDLCREELAKTHASAAAGKDAAPAEAAEAATGTAAVTVAAAVAGAAAAVAGAAAAVADAAAAATAASSKDAAAAATSAAAGDAAQGGTSATGAAQAGSSAAGHHAKPSKRCAVCGTTQAPGSHKLLRCSRCLVEHYCSRECQLKAWPSHRKVCPRT